MQVAVHAPCRVVYTEDMQHGQVVQGVTIRNPFRPLWLDFPRR